MKVFSIERREAIVAKALSRNGQTLHEVAQTNGVGLSTLERWLKEYRNGNASHNNQPLSPQLSQAERFRILVETESLDEQALGSYCREHGIFSHQIEQWKDIIMSNDNQQKDSNRDAELKQLRAENKLLKKELSRKDKALAETSALLILKKKANLIWGEEEDD